MEQYKEKASVLKEVHLEKIISVPQCDTGAPVPTIFSDENSVYLFYFLKCADKNWDGTYINIRGTNIDKGIACIEFKGLNQYKFGYPNDEAIEGHLLYKYGLKI